MSDETQTIALRAGAASLATGYALAVGILLLMGMAPVLLSFPLQFVVGGTAGLLVALVGSHRLAHQLAEGRPGSYALGSALALTTVLIATVAGGAVSLLTQYDTCHTGLVECSYDFLVKPLFWTGSFGFIPAVLLGIGLTWRVSERAHDDQHPEPESPSTHRRAFRLGAALVILLAPPTTYVCCVGQTEIVSRQMSWTPKPEGERPPSGARADDTVTLVFTRAPHHFITVESADFRDWLDRRGPTTLEATFEVTRDFGRVRSYNLVGLEGWPGDKPPSVVSGGSGCGGTLPDCQTPADQRASPW